MEKKKTKLTLSGNLKKSISNIEHAKSHGKNAVVIENTDPGARSSLPPLQLILPIKVVPAHTRPRV